MGTLLNRRRYMGSTDVPITNPYITDGLVFYLDGEYNNGFAAHESNINYWKELVSETNLQPNGTISWGNNYVDFNGNFYFGFTELGANIVSAIRNNTIYIEMILEPVRHGSQGNNGYIAFGANQRGVWFWDNSTWQYSSYSYRTNRYTTVLLYEWTGQKKISRVVFSPNKIDIDGNVFTSNDNLNIGSNDCYIGYVPAGGKGIFKLYSLRVYNRVLAANEIAANYVIDQQRFGLT